MANYRRRKPALGWGGVKRTVLDTGATQELGTGVLGRGWDYYGTDTGGPYLEFFGAPAVEPPSSYGPSGTSEVFATDTTNYNWAVLGGWVVGGDIYNSTKVDWIQKTFTGLTPGDTVGFRFSRSVVLALGDSQIFAEIEGDGTGSFAATPDQAGLWDDFGYPRVGGTYITTTVPLSGEVIVRIGLNNRGPTGENGQGGFDNFELVSIGSPTDTRPNLLVWGTPAGAGQVRSWPQASAGTMMSKRFPSGRRSVWTKPGHDFLQQFVPHIPQVDRLRVGGPNGLDASGADGDTGWRAALEWLRDGGIGTYYPDQDDLSLDPVDCVLVGPLEGRYERDDPSLLRGVDLVLRTLNPNDVFPEY